MTSGCASGGTAHAQRLAQSRRSRAAKESALETGTITFRACAAQRQLACPPAAPPRQRAHLAAVTPEATHHEGAHDHVWHLGQLVVQQGGGGVVCHLGTKGNAGVS